MKTLPRLIYTSLLMVAVAMAYVQPAVSQTPVTAHTLLWRISGKGLQKPSYLYGTMHLSDKRLFRFDDSVYNAIEKTEGLAIEVNPDEMGAYFVNKLFDDMQNGKMLSEVLDKKYFDQNRKALSKKFGKPADEISATDVVREKNKWMSEYMAKGEMPTFVDAYLYNIARRQGKWVGGIEDIGDQAGLMENLIDQSDISYMLATDSSTQASGNHSGMEHMISLYSSQDLEGIEALTDGSQTADQKDMLLIRRNLKMARRIDSLTSLRTMFLAIGAAHLPGESGVINLLRARGFTVAPVFSTKKIASSDYTFQEVHLPWVQVADANQNYTAEMPANPASLKLYGLVEMKFLLDLFNLSGYCTMAVASPDHNANRDTLINRLARRMFTDDEIKASRNINNRTYAGREYIKTGLGTNLRVQVFVEHNMLFLSMISAVKKDALTSADANKFFESFTINPHPVAPPRTSYTFRDSIMGISFVSPVSLQYNEKFSQKHDSSWKISAFTGIDPATGAYIMLFSKEVKEGYYITSDSVLHTDFLQRMGAQYTDVHKDIRMLDSVRLITIHGRSLAQAGIYGHAMSIVRNGRQILLMIITDSAGSHDPVLENVLSSFQFIPYAPATLQKSRPSDSTFTCMVPSPLEKRLDQSGEKAQWASYDSASATSYIVIPDTLGKYIWYASDSLFWDNRVKRNTGSADLQSVKDITNGPLRGKELLLKVDKDGETYERERLLSSGNKTYKLFVSGNKDLLYSDAVNAFFDSFRLDHPDSVSAATISKAGILLKDLGSQDSATRQAAFFALSSAPFGKADLPLLKEALFRIYLSPYDSSRAVFINESLADKIAGLHDSSSISFVKQAYQDLTQKDPRLQNTALSLLIKQRTAESYAALAGLLQQGPSSDRLNYSDIQALEDSLSLTTSLFNAFHLWAKDTLQSAGIADVVLTLLDSGYLGHDSLASFAGAFTSAATRLLPALKANDDYNDVNLPSLVKLIGRFRSRASYDLLNRYLTVKSKDILEEAILQLIKDGQPVPSLYMKRLAADPEYRIHFYDRLKDLKKTSLFPKENLTQPAFAESAIYQSIGEEEGEDDGNYRTKKVVFLTRKTAAFDGKTYVWFLYKVTLGNDEDTHSYLGIAGGYKPNSAGLQPEKDFSGIYWREEFDAVRIHFLFTEFLKKEKQNE